MTASLTSLTSFRVRWRGSDLLRPVDDDLHYTLASLELQTIATSLILSAFAPNTKPIASMAYSFTLEDPVSLLRQSTCVVRSPESFDGVLDLLHVVKNVLGSPVVLCVDTDDSLH